MNVTAYYVYFEINKININRLSFSVVINEPL